MGQIVNLQSQAAGVINSAIGTIVSDGSAAAALAITLGFTPRRIKLINLTDRTIDEWYKGMLENSIYASIVGIALKLDADAGVVDTNYTALWTPVAIAGVNAADNGTPATDAKQMVSALVGMLLKLDADAGVTDTNYTALWTPSTKTYTALVAAIGGMVAKLDADAGVTDTNYTALWACPNTMSLHTVAAGTVTYERVNGIAVDPIANTVTLTAATLAASKQFYFEALG